MRIRPAIAVSAAAAFAVAVPIAAAKTTPPQKVNAHLVAIAPAQGGSGVLTGTALKQKGGVQLKWRLSFTHLSGPATEATLKVNRSGGGVAFALCKPCTANKQGNISLISSLWKTIAAGKGVLVIATAAHPAGELRGALTVG
jgi:CHRD domain